MTNTCRDNCHSDAMKNTPQTAEVHDATHGGFVSEYLVPKMDCPSEEGMIRMALDSVEPKVVLEFDTPEHRRPQNRRHKQKLAFSSGYLPSTASCSSLKSLSAGGRNPLA